MPKKVYIIDGLDCANCAARIESKFNAHPQVEEATITFTTRQLRLTAADPDALIPELTQLARTIESTAAIYPRDKAPKQRPHHDHDHDHACDCGCGHDHHDHDHHEHHHHHDHDHEDHDCHCGHDHHHEHDHDDHTCHCGHDHHHHDHDDHICHCGHHHNHDHHDHEEAHSHDHAHQHDARLPLFGAVSEKNTLLIGAALFALSFFMGPARLKLAFSLAAYFFLGWEVLSTAVKNLKNGHVFDENFLMSIATIGAFCIGEYPEAVGVMLFYRVGEYFEHRAVERSRQQIMDAIDLRPEIIHLAEGDTIRDIPAEQAQPGDIFQVRPGDRIPLDGTVLSGESRIDTAPITGEPVPVRVIPGSAVLSGCVNTVGTLTIRADKALSESMVTRILDSVENAAASKPKIDRFITRFARIYTPAVVAAAALTAIVPSLFTGNWSYWVYTALSFLVMSCPCALVLSVPLAFFSGIGAGSKKGILFKGGQSMEAMARLKAVVLDKTGTITKGDFRVQSILGGMPVLQLCASCEQSSSHPIAVSIVAAAKEKSLELIAPENVLELPGKGIHAKLQGADILCGSARLLQERGIAFEELPDTGAKVYVSVDGVYRGCILIGDTLKPGVEEAVRTLRDQKLATVLLTGDNLENARAAAGKAGIRDVRANLLPHQKLEALQAIRAQHGPTMFVGDGINDAPVLAGADVGAAMGSGADAAIEAADVVYMTSDVAAIPQSLAIARQTQTIAWQNVWFALTIKLIVMILGLMGHASMWLAVFADSGVAMLCVLNSIRILYKR